MAGFPTRFARALTIVVVGIVSLVPTHDAQAETLAGVLRARILRALRGSTSTDPALAVRVDGLSAINYQGWESRRPASTLKLYPGLVALMIFGPEHRLKTEVRATGTLLDGVLDGDMELIGGGDPLLSTTSLKALAQSMRDKGVTLVKGKLFANERHYDRRRDAPAWRDFYIPDEIGPLSALAVAGNRWRKDASYLAEPALGNTQLFRRYLSEVGIKVVGATELGTSALPPAVRTVRTSLRMRDLVTYIEKHSYNFGAELLLKEIGRTIGNGSTAAGVTVVKRWAATFDTTVGTMRDGSGLSTDNRIRPWDEVAWLHRAEKQTVFSIFKRSLPIGCEYHSTLRERYCGTAGAGRVFAKTGNLMRTITLAGYTTTASGRAVRFSFLLPSCENRDTCRKKIDAAVLQIVAFNG
jgi:D-alanyl-D-alanine carboxypeptidase/D-alanyl-D-alanine-endopeptidase (penicillin-binding protein 4)